MTQSTDERVTQVAALLAENAADAGPTGLSGPAAGLLVRRIAPRGVAELGARTLRAFVEEHVRGARAVGTGASWRIVANAYSDTDVSAARRPLGMWQAFVRPNSRSRLVVVDSRVRVVPDGEEESDATPVQLFTPDDHREMARAFVESLEEEFQPFRASLLAAVQDLGEPRWWQRFTRDLGAISSDLAARYLKYRVEYLANALAERLEAAGAAGSELAVVLSDRDVVRRASKPKRDTPTSPGVQSQSLVEFVSRVLPHMAETDLRRLLLPAGAIYDALMSDGPAKQ